jgi:hypothetical protein
VAMMCAGIFDSYFNTIFFGGIKGIQELAKQNAAFLTVLKWIWTIETAISWLDRNKEGYTVLEKLFNLQELDEQERKLAKEMHVGGFMLVAEDEMHNVTGISNVSKKRMHIYHSIRKGIKCLICGYDNCKLELNEKKDTDKKNGKS